MLSSPKSGAILSPRRCSCRATTELNVGTFVWVITLFCALQFPLRLVPELVFASFGFARLLPQLERAFPYLLFGWLGHDESSQSAGPALGRRYKRRDRRAIFTCGPNSQFGLRRVVPSAMLPPDLRCPRNVHNLGRGQSPLQRPRLITAPASLTCGLSPVLNPAGCAWGAIQAG